MRFLSGAVAGAGEGGTGGVVDPGLSPVPRAGGGEVDAEWTGGSVGGEDFGKAVAELRECRTEGEHAGDGGHAGEVEGVAGVVDVTFEDGGFLAAEGERGWSQHESSGGRGRGLFLVAWVGRWGWGNGLKADVASDQ